MSTFYFKGQLLHFPKWRLIGWPAPRAYGLMAPLLCVGRAVFQVHHGILNCNLLLVSSWGKKDFTALLCLVNEFSHMPSRFKVVLFRWQGLPFPSAPKEGNGLSSSQWRAMPFSIPMRYFFFNQMGFSSLFKFIAFPAYLMQNARKQLVSVASVLNT